MKSLSQAFTLCFIFAACGSSATSSSDGGAAKADSGPNTNRTADARSASADAKPAATTDAATAPGINLQSYFPIEVGATWRYKVNNAGVIGNKIQTVLGYEDVGGIKAGTMAFKVQSTKPSGKITISWQENTGTALIRHREHTFAANQSQQTEEFYLPAKLRLDEAPAHLILGASYHYIYTEKIHDFVLAVNTSLLKDEVWTVQAVNVSVTVPAGTFNCIQLHKTNAATGSDKQYWFAKGVGKVKEFSATQTEELKSYMFP